MIVSAVLGALLFYGATGLADDARWAQPDLQRFRKEYIQRETQLQQRHQQARIALLNAALQDSEEVLRQAGLTRNARDIMSAREGRSLVEKMIEQAQAGKAIEWPNPTRPELIARVEQWQKAMNDLDEKQGAESNDLLARGAEHFAKQWAKMTQEPVRPEAQENLFVRFLRYDPSAEKPDPPPASTSVIEEPVTDIPYFAANTSKEESGLLWTRIARWTGDMRGMDVVQIALFDRTQTERTEQRHMMSNKNSTLVFQPMANLPQRADYKFRLKRIEEKDIVDVLEWPTSRNDWHLVVRTRRGTKSIHPTGFVIEAALPSANLKQLLAESDRLIEDPL